MSRELDIIFLVVGDLFRYEFWNNVISEGGKKEQAIISITTTIINVL